jgi:hypothetical protein
MRQHRLAARFGQVDDGKATMAKRDAGLGIDPASAIIRSAMPQRCGHDADRGEPMRIGRFLGKKDADNPTHRSAPVVNDKQAPGARACHKAQGDREPEQRKSDDQVENAEYAKPDQQCR